MGRLKNIKEINKYDQYKTQYSYNITLIEETKHNLQVMNIFSKEIIFFIFNKPLTIIYHFDL